MKYLIQVYKTLLVCISAFSVAVIKQCLRELMKEFNLAYGSRGIWDQRESGQTTSVTQGS